MDAIVDSVLDHLELAEAGLGCSGVVAVVRAGWYLWEAAKVLSPTQGQAEPTPGSKEATEEALSSVHQFELEKLPTGRIKRQDLRVVGVLGYGGFGTVELWEHKVTGETYALKSLKKGFIVKNGLEDSVLQEKDILMMTSSVFVCKLWETYNSAETLDLLLEPCLGGDLYTTYLRRRFYGSEEHCRFYSASVVLAFDHLHAKQIIYRDLKPENILLTQTGHVKLTDMGCAQYAPSGKTFATSGTANYLAPEVWSKKQGHTNAVDWWQLGCLIVELMCGDPPFLSESDDRKQLKASIKAGISEENLPEACKSSESCSNLVLELMKRDPSERLPMKPGGIKNVMNHKWFAEMDWGLMKELKLPPPYVPVVENNRDLQNFSACEDKAPDQLDYSDPGTGWDKDFATSM